MVSREKQNPISFTVALKFYFIHVKSYIIFKQSRTEEKLCRFQHIKRTRAFVVSVLHIRHSKWQIFTRLFQYSVLIVIILD